MKDIFEDHYEDLQVSPKADQETIERVYRLLAKRYHPDNNGSGSVEKFDIITKAYKVLGQAEKRAAYDATYADKKDRVVKAFAQASAPGGFAITAAGVDEVEKDGIILGKDRLLTETTDPNEAADSIRLLEHISAGTSDKFDSVPVRQAGVNRLSGLERKNSTAGRRFSHRTKSTREKISRCLCMSINYLTKRT